MSSDGLLQSGESRDNRPQGSLHFSLDGHCRIIEPHQANKALPTQQGPPAHCQGKESRVGDLQNGLDLIINLFSLVTFS